MAPPTYRMNWAEEMQFMQGENGAECECDSSLPCGACGCWQRCLSSTMTDLLPSNLPQGGSRHVRGSDSPASAARLLGLAS